MKQKQDGMKKEGFTHDGRTIYFIEAKGKDISFERWRTCLYYAPHYAATHFLNSEDEYSRFIADRAAATYQDYGEFRADAEREGIRDNY